MLDKSIVIKTWPDLYAKQSNGKIKHWTVKVIKTEAGTFHAVMEYGQLDGKHQTDIKDASVPKNVGKANETTPEQQALFQAQSEWNEKLNRKGYSEDIETAKLDVVFDLNTLPMKAHNIEDKEKYIVFPGYLQRKYNGVRMLCMKKDGKVHMWSRSAVAYDPAILPEIHSELTNALLEGEMLDGELYRHGMELNDINGASKKRREATSELEYHVYDCPDPSLSFKDRFAKLCKIKSRGLFFARVCFAETVEVKNREDIKKIDEQHCKEGHEGSIFRNAAGKYKAGYKSSDLLKVKQFKDDEFEIIGYEEARDKVDGEEAESSEAVRISTIVFICQAKNGSSFKARPTGSMEKRHEMWNNRDSYIGQKLKVKYKHLTAFGIPEFPVGISIRPDWD